MPVDIGLEAEDRAYDWGTDRTTINMDNPATVNGTITSIDVRASPGNDITGLRVGTFYLTGTNKLKCRASEAIPGTITGEQNKLVSVTVVIGDYIGMYWAAGRVERDNSGFAGIWDKSGEYIDPDDEMTYGVQTANGISLGGYIEEEVVAVGRSFGFIIG